MVTFSPPFYNNDVHDCEDLIVILLIASFKYKNTLNISKHIM